MLLLNIFVNCDLGNLKKVIVWGVECKIYVLKIELW